MGEAALPFVGRALLLETVQGLLGDGRSIVLQGEAGVGKTRLATEALRDGDASGRVVDRLLADEGRSDVLLGVLAPLGPPATVAVEDQAAVFGWFLRHWRARSMAGRPVLVWVDDLHHCDPLSEAILRHAVTTRVVQLVATHRTSERLGGATQSMVTEGLLLPVAVGPLARPAADTLARAAMCRRPDPSRLDPPTLERLNALAAGNPLFVRELVAGLDGGVDLRSSTTVIDLVERPLEGLSVSERRVVEIIAVAEPAPERLLVSRRRDLHELEKHGLVVRRDGTVRVDHPLRRAWVRRDIGSALPLVLVELLDLVETSDCEDEIEPTRLIDWQLKAGRQPDPAGLEQATRLAIARRDGTTAMRFAEAVRGPEAQLLRGHALVTSGRLGEGLDELAKAARGGCPAVRAEAAFAQAAYIGLMVGDFPRAHAALDAVEHAEISSDLRRHIVAGRLWLWIFGPVGDDQALQLARRAALDGPDDALTFELCHGAAAVLHHLSSDPGDIEPLIARCAELESLVSLSTTSLARARTLQASWALCQGDTAHARRILLRALRTAEHDHDPESTALLVGNAIYALALMGRLREAVRVGDGSLATVPPTDDWYAMRSIAELLHHGNRWLVQDTSDSPDPPSSVADGRVNLERLFATRAEVLRREAQGSPRDDRRLQDTLRMLTNQRKHLWAAMFSLEVSSLATDRAVHELMWASSQLVTGYGLVAVSGAVARARLDGDGSTLLRCAVDLEWAGLAALALRVAADASALLEPSTSEGRQAGAAVLRAARDRDGQSPKWLEAVGSLPTPRQMSVAWRVVDGATAASVASELVLSPRTVENHLQRVYRALRVHGRDELTELLRPRVRPSKWQLGRCSLGDGSSSSAPGYSS
ncbi:MAG: LuxR C-terminal-related transcriptional regulator [Ornithinimicrobium sp.]